MTENLHQQVFVILSVMAHRYDIMYNDTQVVVKLQEMQQYYKIKTGSKQR